MNNEGSTQHWLKFMRYCFIWEIVWVCGNDKIGDKNAGVAVAVVVWGDTMSGGVDVVGVEV